MLTERTSVAFNIKYASANIYYTTLFCLECIVTSSKVSVAVYIARCRPSRISWIEFGVYQGFFFFSFFYSWARLYTCQPCNGAIRRPSPQLPIYTSFPFPFFFFALQCNSPPTWIPNRSQVLYISKVAERERPALFQLYWINNHAIVVVVVVVLWQKNVRCVQL